MFECLGLRTVSDGIGKIKRKRGFFLNPSRFGKVPGFYKKKSIARREGPEEGSSHAAEEEKRKLKACGCRGGGSQPAPRTPRIPELQVERALGAGTGRGDILPGPEGPE